MAEIIHIKDFATRSRDNFDSKEPSEYFKQIFNFGRLCQNNITNPYSMRHFMNIALDQGVINIQEAEYVAGQLGFTLY